MRILLAALLCAAVLAGGARAQAPALFSADQFDKVDLVPNQAGGGGAGLLETLGAATDRFEPINGFNEGNKYRVLGRSIGRLKVLVTLPGGGRGVATCTAALIAPDRLLTNYHCVPGAEGQTVEQVKVEFLYLDLGSHTARAFAADPAPVEADKALDYAILKVFGDPPRVAGIAPLAFKPRAIQNSESLFLIHHPAGQPQRLTRAFCRAHGGTAADGAGHIRHLCDTLPGSSGALVFADDDFAVVGLHHAGGMTPGDATSFNEGIDVLALERKSAALAALAVPSPSHAKDAKSAPVKLWPLAKPAEPAAAKQEEPKPAEKPAPAKRPMTLAALAPIETRAAKPLTEAEQGVLKTGDTFKECADCPEMVVVPAGDFTMGSNEGASDEKPPHKVTIAKAFAVGKFEVTFAEWAACVSGGGYSSNKAPGDEGWGRDTRPVINVSWNEAKEYAAWLTTKTGATYRLLSEAEWEYAARAGTKTRYAFGDTITKSQAQFSEGAWGSAGKTVEVGSFKPNAFGLYDMHGNVWEWVEDCYADNYNGAPTDGTPRKTIGDCVSRVLRGGSWSNNPNGLRSANRTGIQPVNRFGNNGFRLART